MKKGSLIYLCGPITGTPNGNRLMFTKAESYYVNRGYHVINPHNIADMLGDVPEHIIMRDELAAITTVVDALAILPGWETSEGSKTEIQVAKKSGIPMITAFTFNPTNPSIKISAHGTKGSKRMACPIDTGTQAPCPNTEKLQMHGLNGKNNRKARARFKRTPIRG